MTQYLKWNHVGEHIYNQTTKNLFYFILYIHIDYKKKTESKEEFGRFFFVTE